MKKTSDEQSGTNPFRNLTCGKRGNKKDLLWLTLQGYSKEMNQIRSEASKNSGQCLRSTMKREIKQNSMSKHSYGEYNLLDPEAVILIKA